MKTRIKIGSAPFFESYSDYKPHDTDYMVFVDEVTKVLKIVVTEDNKREDWFYYKKGITKEELIEYELEHCKQKPCHAGKFLIPDVVEYFGITLDDLRQFEEFFENLDFKHTYEKIIYDAYIENNAFTLTQEQRDAAYNDYKEKRIKNKY